MTIAPQTHRLFFALWPDAQARAALARLQAGAGGTPVPAAKLHLTLAFLGAQPAAALPALCRMLDEVPAHPLTLDIDTYGYFSGPRIAWAGMRAPPAALLALQAQLMQRLRQEQWLTQAESPFRPHVTLARRASGVPAGPCAPLRWQAAELVLVESLPASAEYRIRAARRLA